MPCRVDAAVNGIWGLVGEGVGCGVEAIEEHALQGHAFHFLDAAVNGGVGASGGE